MLPRVWKQFEQSRLEFTPDGAPSPPGLHELRGRCPYRLPQPLRCDPMAARCGCQRRAGGDVLMGVLQLLGRRLLDAGATMAAGLLACFAGMSLQVRPDAVLMPGLSGQSADAAHYRLRAETWR